MLPTYWLIVQRWLRRQLGRVPFLHFEQSRPPQTLQQSGYSDATLQPTRERRPAPPVVLPVWAALLLFSLLGAFLIGGLLYGGFQFVQSRQLNESAVVPPVALVTSTTVSTLTPTVAATLEPTPTPVPTAIPSPTPLLSEGLASSWSDSILQWSAEIIQVSDKYGLDPNLLAAIIEQESGGDPTGVSYAGAVGLMGIMPYNDVAGLNERPSAQVLADPVTNIEWGAQILHGYLMDLEGDLYWTLAVYNGGWIYAETATPRAYAEVVLDRYARAVIARAGVAVEADQWTIALKQEGKLSAEPLISDDHLRENWPLYAKHTFLAGDIPIIGYAVPLSLD